MTNKALLHLSQDPIMTRLISHYGEIEVKPSGADLFTDLIECIIGQQLSNKAASTITNRFKASLKNLPMDPSEIAGLDLEVMRSLGLSYAKARYSQNIAHAVLDGSLHINSFPQLSDDEVKSELVRIKGIGPWTAEMFLMFTLGRPNIFSHGDLGLKNAIIKNYGFDPKNELTQLQILLTTWSPYLTTACRYLWKSLDNS
jgi:DNA-3-methyladenine glycosylase II